MKKEKLLSKRVISILIIVLLFLVTIFLGNFIKDNTKKRIHHHKEDIVENKPSYSMVNKDNTVSDNFSTHLPLVVIDTNGEKPKADSEWDKEKGYFAPIDQDPYVKGNISIIDNDNGTNNVNDIPATKSDMRIRLRGNTSLTFDKKQYFIKLINSDGSKNKQNILRMGKEHEWILNISFIDKSLLRNYMSLNIAGEIMENTPDTRYCEVIIKDNDAYAYQGVYLIMESVKQGEDRVNISKYDNKFKTSSYLLRRDRFDENGLIINNYAKENKLTTGYLDIKHPSKKEITDETIDYITKDINDFEKAIFSKDPKEFYKYKEYIDEESFIDYFIINEFFANYDAGYHSTYMYKEINEKIMMGPVWDFDMDIDNSKKMPLKIDSTAMHDTPWFRQLLRDSEFTTKLINRYHELRKTVLSEENIIRYIDETIDYIGPAQKRDWNRWDYFYTSKYLFDIYDDKGNVIDRNTKTYEDEIKKMKTVLIEHGSWLDENIDTLYQFSEFNEENISKSTFEKIGDFVLGKDNDISLSSILSIMFVVVFVVTIILVQRD